MFSFVREYFRSALLKHESHDLMRLFIALFCQCRSAFQICWQIQSTFSIKESELIGIYNTLNISNFTYIILSSREPTLSLTTGYVFKVSIRGST